MDGRKGWRFETTITAVTLLNLGLLVNTWSENFYYNATQMIANATGAKDCWICTTLPKGDRRLPLYRVGSTPWNCDNNTWPKFRRRHDAGYCDYDNPTYMTGPRFDLQILDNNTQILVSNNSCLWKARSNTCSCRTSFHTHKNCTCRDLWNDY